MYVPGSDHYKRRSELGKSTDIDTMKEARGLIKKIIADFGDTFIEDLTIILVTGMLLKMECSGSRKNRYIQVLGEVYQEAAWYGSNATRPDFPTFSRNVRKADKFTTEELNRIFIQENFPSEAMFLFFLCCLSGGLRLGEVRAIRRKQIIFDRKALIVDGFCKQNGKRTNYNKMGSPDDPKFRIVFLSDLTLGKLQDYLNRHEGIRPEDFCFTREDGEPFRSEYAEDVFSKALEKAGLATEGRKLVPHSLRYTYVSRMRRELTAAELQPMTGHTSIEMVDYYNSLVLDAAIAKSPKAEIAVNNLFV
jgi:integrase